MDWFERITGFREGDPEGVRARLFVDGDQLVSRVDGSRHGIGRFEVPTLAQLRRRLADAGPPPGTRTQVRGVVGDARAMHLDPAWVGALFQVASQFNALEMVSPMVTPEQGVTRYEGDATQGPACAMAAGAATIWRNHFMPLGGRIGQSADCQLDTLSGLGAALSAALGQPVSALWSMRNGYALARPEGLQAITSWLQGQDEPARDRLRGELAVAWHRDVEVTDAPPGARPRVSQIFCSALPVAYTPIPPARWAAFAQLVLEAAYEATLCAAALQRRGGGSGRVLLTRLGGGAFGNADEWIDRATARALERTAREGLEVGLVSFRQHHPSWQRMAQTWAAD